MEKPTLQPLPASPYEFAYWKKSTVHLDYHVEVVGQYYSVPYPLVKKQLDIRYTKTTVECLYRNQRIAAISATNPPVVIQPSENICRQSITSTLSGAQRNQTL